MESYIPMNDKKITGQPEYDEAERVIGSQALAVVRRIANELYPDDVPRTFGDLCQQVCDEVRAFRQEEQKQLARLEEKYESLEKQCQGYASANAALGWLLKQNEAQAHEAAERAMAMVRTRLAGGRIIGVIKDEDKATFGLIVIMEESGEQYRVWMHKDERKNSPAYVEIEVEPHD